MGRKLNSESNRNSAGRIAALDILRGVTILSMIAYHTCWDLVYIAGKDWPWYRGTGAFLWQQSICWTFILLAGFCAALGKRTLRRGLTVFACGVIVSLATLLVMPEAPIIYGILTLHGSSMILVALMQRAGVLPDVSGGGVERVASVAAGSSTGEAGAGSSREAGNAADARNSVERSAIAGPVLSAAIFVVTYSAQSGYLGFFRKCIVPLPLWLYINPINSLTTFLGFKAPGFSSSDYFPLIPWFFLFLCGYFAGVLWKQRVAQPSMNSAIEKSLPVRCLGFLGRHSLLIYMLHQPIIYGVVWLLYLR